jgi:adenylyltransferase/sulfurtransferase
VTTSGDRHERQQRLPEWGEEGQRRLRSSHVLLVGCGALGTVAAELLVRAGVGTITIVDRDRVEAGNLHRQFLFDARDAALGIPKAEAAKARLAAIDPNVRVRGFYDDFAPRNARRYAESVDCIVDGLDNLETRYLLNDLAVDRGIPYVYGAAVGTEGMCAVVRPGLSPCLRCLFPELPPPGTIATCETNGVLNAATALVASLEVAQALKMLVGRPDRLEPGLIAVDLWSNTWRRIETAAGRDPSCPCCAERRFEFLDGDRLPDVSVFCGKNAVQIAPRTACSVDLPALAERLGSFGTFTHAAGRIEGSLSEPAYSLVVFGDGRVVVGGTSDPEVARSIAARFVGT